MAELVSPNQVSFIPGRDIHDNIVVAQELVHCMHRMNGNKQFMAIKVDLEKAYDRLRWGFIDETLEAVGVPDRLRHTIMNCISSIHMRILWNGETIAEFSTSRGIRQCYSLSPYLFVLCIERLAHLIQDTVDDGRWQPIKASKSLSMAGRITLAKSIIQAMLSYAMHTMQLPILVSKEIQRLCRDFVWGHSTNQRKLHLVKWATIVKPTKCDGMGLWDLPLFNTTILTKRGWGFLTRRSALWVQVLRGKYGDRSDSSLTLSYKSTGSWQWRGIAKAWNLVAGGVVWSVRNSEGVLFWEDRWIRGAEPLLHAVTTTVDAAAASSRVRETIVEYGRAYLATGIAMVMAPNDSNIFVACGSRETTDKYPASITTFSSLEAVRLLLLYYGNNPACAKGLSSCSGDGVTKASSNRTSFNRGMKFELFVQQRTTSNTRGICGPTPLSRGGSRGRFDGGGLPHGGLRSIRMVHRKVIRELQGLEVYYGMMMGTGFVDFSTMSALQPRRQLNSRVLWWDYSWLGTVAIGTWSWNSTLKWFSDCYQMVQPTINVSNR
ncbi:hypothetical protein CRG98_007590 [Punica granatum]|uniref:Reverse transcriptase domain-containing protein n=1 Tax=Punica granatum TaxID=22663 RepID=A0A2I0KU94_PUNGR|nr:hypothetical protein CRG98_007590 [Punica granatum]